MPELGTSGSVRGRDGQPPGLLDRNALMPAAPCRPCQKAFHALLRGQHEPPEEAPNLPDTQSHRSPRAALKVAKLLGVGWVDIFFGASCVGGWAARSTVNSA